VGRNKRNIRYYEKYSIPPLKLQFESGYEAFTTQEQWIRVLKTGEVVITTSNPYPLYTMQAKEWQRGYDIAYFEKQGELIFKSRFK
jgi:hypothetical protein